MAWGAISNKTYILVPSPPLANPTHLGVGVLSRLRPPVRVLQEGDLGRRRGHTLLYVAFC